MEARMTELLQVWVMRTQHTWSNSSSVLQEWLSGTGLACGRRKILR